MNFMNFKENYKFFRFIFAAIPVSTSNSVIHVKQPAEINNEQQDDPMSDDEQVIVIKSFD